MIFLILKCNGRNLFLNQGWSLQTLFNEMDGEFFMNSLQDVLNIYEGVNFSAISFLVQHCNLSNRIQDRQDYLLLESLINDIIREDILTVNRFRLSDSPHIFVPNKILYNDYLEIVKNIPQKAVHDIFNIRAISQKEKDAYEAKNLLVSLKMILKRSFVLKNIYLDYISFIIKGIAHQL